MGVGFKCNMKFKSCAVERGFQLGHNFRKLPPPALRRQEASSKHLEVCANVGGFMAMDFEFMVQGLRSSLRFWVGVVSMTSQHAS